MPDTARKTETRQIAERMRLARRLAGFSQEDAARALDVTVRTYARWETAETAGFLSELGRIAKLFSTTVEELRQVPDERIASLEKTVEAMRVEIDRLRGKET